MGVTKPNHKRGQQAAGIPGRAGKVPRARPAAFHVVFARDVIDDIRAHGRSSPEVEVCGVLVGNAYDDDNGAGCYIAANIRGNGAEGRNAQVTFTSDTWAHINTMMDNRYADERIVGWYHTHPGFGIFLSEMDLFIHRNFFAEPWQIAYVDDPKGDDRGVFVWENGEPVRRPLQIGSAIGAPVPGDRIAKRNKWAAAVSAGVLLLLGALAAAWIYKGTR